MKEELTTKMHSEFKVSKLIDIRHRAGCVWTLMKWRNRIEDEESVRQASAMYGITYEQATKWKDYWLN